MDFSRKPLRCRPNPLVFTSSGENDLPPNFTSEEFACLLRGKFVVVIGDSVMRSVYKDLILFLSEDRILDYGELRRKGERSFRGDELIEGGTLGEMVNGPMYREVRQFQRDEYLVRFYFVTRVYNRYMETCIADLLSPQPDVVIMNSCLWDITRYGASGMDFYKENLERLFDLLKRILPFKTLVIWLTTMPISETVTGGVIQENIRFLSSVLRFDVLMANFFASQVAKAHDFDVLDLHYVFRRKLHHRLHDGIHWNSTAHRYITNMLIEHICEAWHVKLPITLPVISPTTLLEDCKYTSGCLRVVRDLDNVDRGGGSRRVFEYPLISPSRSWRRLRRAPKHPSRSGSRRN